MMETCNINLILDGGMQLPVLGTHKEITEKLVESDQDGMVEFKCYGTLQSPTRPPSIVESFLYLKRSQVVGFIAMTGKTVLSAQTNQILQG